MKRILASIAAIVAAIAITTGGSAAAIPVQEPTPTPPPGIVLSTNDTTCGQVTVTAHGFGLAPGTTYQIVADRAVRAVVADLDNTAATTFALAESGAWGTVAIRTASGGYLAASTNLGAGTAWYHVIAC